MDVISKEFFFILIRDLQHIRNKPAGIVAVPVKIRNFEIPAGYLQEMEFHILHRFKFKVSVLDFSNKQGHLIGTVKTVKIIIHFIGIFKYLVDVHEIKFMAEGMKEKFEVRGISDMGKKFVEPRKINI
jgi:hypothetical protein